MGAYVSVAECRTHFNITVDCNGTKLEKGKFESDPDIAGVGILGVFLGVTCFALALSIFDVFWQFAKFAGWKSAKRPEGKRAQRRRSVSDILETLVLTCSDQQVFTGAAYALTLRYWRGCTVSAYHYNLVANMMLLTCATHLMSVTIVRNYWRYPWLAILRVACISGVFIVTGLLMVNQNANHTQYRFPTDIPPAEESESLMFLPAACFQTDKSQIDDTFTNTTKTVGDFGNVILNSTPGNMIHGWNWYVIILLFYGAAIIAESIRFVRRGKTRPGWRANLGDKFAKLFKANSWQRKLVSIVFLIYLIAGVGVSCAAVAISARYIFALRAWVDRSGWIEREENGTNPENDATTFGQLVPIFMSAFIIFSFAQTISEKVTDHENRKHAGETKYYQQGTTAFLDPSNYDLISSIGKADTTYYGAGSATPGTIDLETGQPWPANKPIRRRTDSTSIAGTPGFGPNTASPLLGIAGSPPLKASRPGRGDNGNGSSTATATASPKPSGSPAVSVHSNKKTSPRNSTQGYKPWPQRPGTPEKKPSSTSSSLDP